MSWVDKIENILRAALGDTSRLVPPGSQVTINAVGLVVRVVLPPGADMVAQTSVRAALKSLLPLGVTVDARLPLEFPFTLHGLNASLPVVLPSVTDRVQEFSVQLEHLDDLERAYTTLLGQSHAVDVIATFALGGVAPLQHVVAAELRTGGAATEALIGRLQQRFHLFPGLSWDPPARYVSVFTGWLDSLEAEGIRLLMFDTTFTGNAVDRMEKVIKDYVFAGGKADLAEVRVVGVRDKSRGAPPIATKHEVLTSRARSVELYVEEIAVGQLVTEDKESLIGYESLRQVLGLEPRCDAGIVEVQQGSDIVDLRGSVPISQCIADLVRGPRRRTPLGSEDEFLGRAISMIALLSNAADREREGLVRAFDAKLLTREEFDTECAGQKKRSDAMVSKYKQKAGLT